MPENGGEFLHGQFLRVQRQVFLRVGLAEPLHVVFDEELHHFAADAGASLQGLPNTAAGGHVRAESHKGLRFESGDPGVKRGLGCD